MACPALPLCGLAVTEAERALPALHARLRATMTRLGLGATESLAMRVTGCPNGCARPYAAELGLVGDGPNSYQLWTGGCAAGTRLNELYADRVKVQGFEEAVEPLLAFWAANRRPNETFGDCCARAGAVALRAYAAGYVGAAAEAVEAVHASGEADRRSTRSAFLPFVGSPRAVSASLSDGRESALASASAITTGTRA